jgi:hypothetical protein
MDAYTYAEVPPLARPPVCGTCRWWVPLDQHERGQCTIETEPAGPAQGPLPPAPDVAFWGCCAHYARRASEAGD